MKFLNKLKNANFWISLISAGVLVAQSVFDFEIKTEYLNQILLGLMGILTMFGVVSDHGGSNSEVTISSSSNSTDTTNSNIKSICDTITLLLNKASIKVGEDTSEQLEQLLNILTNTKTSDEEMKNSSIEETENIQSNNDINCENIQTNATVADDNNELVCDNPNVETVKAVDNIKTAEIENIKTAETYKIITNIENTTVSESQDNVQEVVEENQIDN